MLHAKLYLLCLVLITQLTALLVDGVAYFPTEISRTAAGPWAYSIFVAGAMGLWPVVFSTHATPVTLPVWCLLVGFSILAVYDDVRYWSVHMVGVSVVMLGACLGAYERGVSALFPLILGLALYGLRLVLTIAAIVAYEIPPIAIPAENPTLLGQLHVLFHAVVARKRDIMYRGAVACLHPQHVMPTFQVGGVLQWCAFVALSFIF